MILSLKFHLQVVLEKLIKSSDSMGKMSCNSRFAKSDASLDVNTIYYVNHYD